MKVLSTLISSLLIFATPSFADCTVTEDCSAYVRKGAPAPFDGVLLSTKLANEANVKLKVNEKLLEEAASYCDSRVDIERNRGEQLIAVEKQASHDREVALLRNLDEEKARSVTLLNQANDAETSAILWGAGGLGAGILMGIVATVAVGVYVAVTADQVP